MQREPGTGVGTGPFVAAEMAGHCRGRRDGFWDECHIGEKAGLDREGKFIQGYWARRPFKRQLTATEVHFINPQRTYNYQNIMLSVLP